MEKGVSGRKGTDVESFGVLPSDLGPMVDQELCGLDALDGEQGSLSVLVGQVDVATFEEEVGQDVELGVRGGCVEGCVGVFVGNVGG